MKTCPRCPHEDHEFSTCLEYPECQCYDRPGIPGGICDNTLLTVLDKQKEEWTRVPNRKMRRKAKRKRRKLKGSRDMSVLPARVPGEGSEPLSS